MLIIRYLFDSLLISLKWFLSSENKSEKIRALRFGSEKDIDNILSWELVIKPTINLL